MPLKAPFPYFGGKSTVAPLVWRALGQPKHYIEPFFGSGAVLLARPHYQAGVHIETINDKAGYVANVWRALQYAPDEVARYCDWPVNHADLSARKSILIAEGSSLLTSLIVNETYYDAKLAGYWVWAASCWIGSGLTSLGQRPHIASGGEGIHALGRIPHISDGGKGIHALGQRNQTRDAFKSVQEPYNTTLYTWFRELSERLRYVRVVCGDWTRVCGGDWQDDKGTVGIFFDPPYSVEDRDGVYDVDSRTVAADVARWAVERGARASYRIVLAGYYEEHSWLLEHGWSVERWSSGGGYASLGEGAGRTNRHREALFMSPHCQKLTDGVQGVLPL